MRDRAAHQDHALGAHREERAEARASAGAKVLRNSPQAFAVTATRAAAKATEIAGWLKEDIRTFRATRTPLRRSDLKIRLFPRAQDP